MGKQVVAENLKGVIPAMVTLSEETLNTLVTCQPDDPLVALASIMDAECDYGELPPELNLLSVSVLTYVTIRRLALVAELADRGDVSAAELATLVRTGVQPESSTPSPLG